MAAVIASGPIEVVEVVVEVVVVEAILRGTIRNDLANLIMPGVGEAGTVAKIRGARCQ